MENYILASSFNHSNIQDRVWYAMTEDDKASMITDPKVKLLFGDKVWVIATKKLYIFGNDNTWYEM